MKIILDILILLAIAWYFMAKSNPEKFAPFITKPYGKKRGVILIIFLIVLGGVSSMLQQQPMNANERAQQASDTASKEASNAIKDDNRNKKNKILTDAQEAAVQSIKQKYSNASEFNMEWDNYEATENSQLLDIRGSFKSGQLHHQYTARIGKESNECVRLTIDDHTIFWNESRQDEIVDNVSKNKK
jgi:uncharacterized membrane protein YwzB